MKKLIILMALLSAPLAFCSEDYDMEIVNIKTNMRMMKHDFENEMADMKFNSKIDAMRAENKAKWDNTIKEISEASENNFKGNDW